MYVKRSVNGLNCVPSCIITFDRRSNSNGEKERSMWRPLRIEANYSQRRTPIIPCH